MLNDPTECNSDFNKQQKYMGYSKLNTFKQELQSSEGEGHACG